jgi:hypothetical protein
MATDRLDDHLARFNSPSFGELEWEGIRRVVAVLQADIVRMILDAFRSPISAVLWSRSDLGLDQRLHVIPLAAGEATYR